MTQVAEAVALVSAYAFGWMTHRLLYRVDAQVAAVRARLMYGDIGQIAGGPVYQRKPAPSPAPPSMIVCGQRVLTKADVDAISRAVRDAALMRQP